MELVLRVCSNLLMGLKHSQGPNPHRPRVTLYHQLSHLTDGETEASVGRNLINVTKQGVDEVLISLTSVIV